MLEVYITFNVDHKTTTSTVSSILTQVMESFYGDETIIIFVTKECFTYAIFIKRRVVVRKQPPSLLIGSDPP